MIMCDKSNNNTQSTADYLAQLINDRKQVTAFPNVFMHVERLIDEGKIQIHFPFLNSEISTQLGSVVVHNF